LIWPFIALIKERGGDTSRIATWLGLNQQQLDDPETRVPQAFVARLLTGAVERSGQRDLGLIAARYVDTQHFGITEYLARTRPTLRAALDDMGRFMPLLGDGAGFSVERKGNRRIVRFWFSSDVVFPEAAYEFVIAIAILRARRLTGKPDLAPVEVSFMHPRPESTKRHEELFRCPVHFGAEVTHWVLSERHLEVPIASAEPALGALLERQAAQMLERLPRGDDVASRVTALLGGAASLRTASADRIARRLGMSVRTLSRKLSDEGTSFRLLIDTAREHAARRELAQTKRSLTEIAERLGFANPQSFHRAFKRWTGDTANGFRQRARVRSDTAGTATRANKAAKAKKAAKR
jgi:AraC-like DNA-binding protein